jgi:uncharacterized protein YybS (DUF2232 family)
MQNKTRAMIEASLMVTLTCIFAMVGTYIPLLTFILFFVPIPFIVLGKRHGIHYVVLSIFAAAMITGGLVDPLYSIFVIVLPGITAIVIGYMMNKEYTPQKILIGGALAALASALFSIHLTSVISGVGLITQMTEIFKEAMEIQINMYKSMGWQGNKIDQLTKSLETTGRMVVMVVPAAIIILSTFLAYINYRLSVKILNRIGYSIDPLPSFREFRLPKSIIMGTFLIMGLTIIMKYLNIVHYGTLAMNIFVIFQFIYLLQGLAVVSYFISFFHLGKTLKIVLFILLLFSRIGIFIITVLGFIDAFANFRKLKTDR